MKKYTPPEIKVYGKTCYLVSKKAMKDLYDANLHQGTYVMYNGAFYVKPDKLSEQAKIILKQHGLYLPTT